MSQQNKHHKIKTKNNKIQNETFDYKTNICINNYADNNLPNIAFRIKQMHRSPFVRRFDLYKLKKNTLNQYQALQLQIFALAPMHSGWQMDGQIVIRHNKVAAAKERQPRPTYPNGYWPNGARGSKKCATKKQNERETGFKLCLLKYGRH